MINNTKTNNIMLSQNNVINLEDFRSRNGNQVSKVFTGRDRGKFVRTQSHIDELERQYEHIKIIIPKDIYSLNPSFLEEFLVNVVRKLGKEKFMSKFEFVSEGKYQYASPLNQAINRILVNTTALD